MTVDLTHLKHLSETHWPDYLHDVITEIEELRQEKERLKEWEKRAVDSMDKASDAVGVPCCDLIPEKVNELKDENKHLESLNNFEVARFNNLLVQNDALVAKGTAYEKQIAALEKNYKLMENSYAKAEKQNSELRESNECLVKKLDEAKWFIENGEANEISLNCKEQDGWHSRRDTFLATSSKQTERKRIEQQMLEDSDVDEDATCWENLYNAGWRKTKGDENA